MIPRVYNKTHSFFYHISRLIIGNSFKRLFVKSSEAIFIYLFIKEIVLNKCFCFYFFKKEAWKTEMKHGQAIYEILVQKYCREIIVFDKTCKTSELETTVFLILPKLHFSHKKIIYILIPAKELHTTQPWGFFFTCRKERVVLNGQYPSWANEPMLKQMLFRSLVLWCFWFTSKRCLD